MPCLTHLTSARGVYWVTEHQPKCSPRCSAKLLPPVDTAHPWSLSGGGAVETLDVLNSQTRTLEDLQAEIWMTGLTLEDEIYCFNPEFAHRSGVAEICVRVVIGDDVRDFQVNAGDNADAYFKIGRAHV